MTQTAPITPPTGFQPPPEQRPTVFQRIRRLLIGSPRDVADRSLFHRLSLIPFLAWVGLGADGLSSSAYGPAEAYLALGDHTYLALAMALATGVTVLVISAAYSRIIEAFPQGGGGYVVASKLLGSGPGVLSGCALVVDYVLTITVSVAAAGDAIYSLLPEQWAPTKLTAEVVLILLGITYNIRGVKDSILPLVPIFLLFVLTHALLILVGIVREAPHAAATSSEVVHGFSSGWSTLGAWGMFVLFVRAYSLGAGTYTGIEAVSNGLSIMRAPQVQTGRRTMTYMAISLAVTAAGLLLCYLLAEVRPIEDMTLNAVLAQRTVNGMPGGWVFVWALLLSEAAILIVAAQTGFIGGPRVLANMALDGWIPRRFASLSERLTAQNGIALMGIAAAGALLFTHGHVHTLVLMYSINVFITFTLSMASMLRRSLDERRRKVVHARRDIALFSIGLVLCAVILLGTSIMKFGEGGWITLAATACFVCLCALTRLQYTKISRHVAKLEQDLQLPAGAVAAVPPAIDPGKPTAALLVGSYNGLGIHTMLQAMSSFGGYFKNVVFLTVGVIDSGTFKGQEEMDHLRQVTEAGLKRYTDLANRLGLPATGRWSIGLDPVIELEKLCLDVARDFPQTTFFAGQLIFQREQWHHRLLHNQTAYALQKRLQWDGIPMLILPVRVR